MEFGQNKPIYLQIAETFYEKVLCGSLADGERVPSVRETAANLGVNPNTVMRSYEIMTDEGIIFNKRGIGYFICEGARDKVLGAQRRSFLEEEWPEISRKLNLLGINIAELTQQI